MHRLEVSCAVRRIYTSLGAKGLMYLRRTENTDAEFDAALLEGGQV